MKKISVWKLIGSLLLPIVVGAISAALSSDGMKAYKTMEKPPLSPPAWVFSVAWTILYIIMGLAFYFIVISEKELKSRMYAIAMYTIQLAMNFMWSIIFFNYEMYLFAFVWLIIMWALVIYCACIFYRIDRKSTFLFIPYILWLTFAAYLNMGTFILNG